MRATRLSNWPWWGLFYIWKNFRPFFCSRDQERGKPPACKWYSKFIVSRKKGCITHALQPYQVLNSSGVSIKGDWERRRIRRRWQWRYDSILKKKNSFKTDADGGNKRSLIKKTSLLASFSRLALHSLGVASTQQQHSRARAQIKEMSNESNFFDVRYGDVLDSHLWRRLSAPPRLELISALRNVISRDITENSNSRPAIKTYVRI